MAAEMTERERTMFEHLKQAQELGSTLTDYAAAYNVNVQDLYSGKAQLQRKGLWPSKVSGESTKSELLAVQVIADPAVEEPTVCRLCGPGGWILECRGYPPIEWLAALVRASAS